MQRLHAHLETGAPLRDMGWTRPRRRSLRNYGLLSLKPLLIVLNVGDNPAEPALRQLGDYRHRAQRRGSPAGPARDGAGADAAGGSRRVSERVRHRGAGAEPGDPPELQLLGLHSFFTVGEDEVRAWTIPVGATAVEAAGVIHTDLARGFIRAEVVAYDALMQAGSLPAARQKGLLRLEGKDYVVQDGDILNIRFNV